jgi:hypothetical protein
MDRQQGWNMDTQETKLEELRQALNNYTAPKEPQANTFSTMWQTDSISWQDLTTMQIPSLTTSQITSIDLSQLTQGTILGGGGGGSGGITYGGSGGSGSGNLSAGHQQVWATTGATTGTSYNWSQNMNIVKINAEDLEINGKSVMKTLERIETQLGLLDCDEAMENDWKELREAGNKYRRVKKRIEEKLQTFSKLKQPIKKG